MFRVTPPEVIVTVRGKMQLLLDLEQADISAFVDVSDMGEAYETWRTVQVTLPLGLTKEEVKPSTVRVQYSPTGRTTPSTEPLD
jgi:hypothetical protein